jgi:hypothetical protein
LKVYSRLKAQREAGECVARGANEERPEFTQVRITPEMLVYSKKDLWPKHAQRFFAFPEPK